MIFLGESGLISCEPPRETYFVIRNFSFQSPWTTAGPHRDRERIANCRILNSHMGVPFLGIREIQPLSGNGQPPATSELRSPPQGAQDISRRVVFISDVFERDLNPLTSVFN